VHGNSAFLESTKTNTRCVMNDWLASKRHSRTQTLTLMMHIPVWGAYYIYYQAAAAGSWSEGWQPACRPADWDVRDMSQTGTDNSYINSSSMHQHRAGAIATASGCIHTTAPSSTSYQPAHPYYRLHWSLTSCLSILVSHIYACRCTELTSHPADNNSLLTWLLTINTSHHPIIAA